MKNGLPFLFVLLFLSVFNWCMAQKPGLHIISIGISEYALQAINLRFAKSDAEELAQAFYNQPQLWQVKTVHVLTNQQATRQNILQHMRMVSVQAQKEDFVVIVYSGHGTLNSIVPYDYSPNNPLGTTINKDTLYSCINRLPCGFMMIFDACYSAGFIKTSSFTNDKDLLMSSKEDEEVAKAVKELVAALKATDKPNFIYASSSSSKKSWECESCKHGYLIQGILDAFVNKPLSIVGKPDMLPDSDKNGFLNFYEMDDYIKQFVKVKASIEQDTQRVYSTGTFGEKFPVVKTLKGEVERVDRDGDRVYDVFDACPDETGEVLKMGCKEYFPVEYVEPLSGGRMIRIKGAAFRMGSNTGMSDEFPEHQVVLADYYIGQTEITRRQWSKIMETPLQSNECPDCPMTGISWNGVQVFLDTLYSRTGVRYRLPTEAEWELAASKPAGENSISAKGNWIDSMTIQQCAWFMGNAQQTVHPVSHKMANGNKLYDVLGNAWEWCSDWYEYKYYKSAPELNPLGPQKGKEKVRRGGSISSSVSGCQYTNRGYAPADAKLNDTGFRLARTIPVQQP